jgi:hypothetical protein
MPTETTLRSCLDRLGEVIAQAEQLQLDIEQQAGLTAARSVREFLLAADRCYDALCAELREVRQPFGEPRELVNEPDGFEPAWATEARRRQQMDPKLRELHELHEKLGRFLGEGDG